jgi:hypothetical protein
MCTDTLKMAEIDVEVARASAKLGGRPKVVAIDCGQLVPGFGTRYERVSDTLRGCASHGQATSRRGHRAAKVAFYAHLNQPGRWQKTPPQLEDILGRVPINPLA